MRFALRPATLLLAVTALLWAATARAEKVALVIGMGDYIGVPKLENALNDARAIAETLEGVGFKVTLSLDSPLAPLMDTIDEFAFRAETADLALVYFAGHGVEVQGENFLIPVDARVASNLDVQRQSISLDQLLEAVEGAREMRVVILDACRDNPFGDSIDLTSPPKAPPTQMARREARAAWASPPPTRNRAPSSPLPRAAVRLPWMARATTAPLRPP